MDVQENKTESNFFEILDSLLGDFFSYIKIIWLIFFLVTLGLAIYYYSIKI
jgi:hypothetical protein